MWSVSTLDLDTLNKLSGVPDVRVVIVRDVLHGEHLAVLLRLLVLWPERRIRLQVTFVSLLLRVTLTLLTPGEGLQRTTTAEQS